MTNPESAVATRPHAEPESAAGRMPADGHMWFFVLGDLIIFGGYFIIFMICRAQQRTLFLDSQQHLNVTVGVVNTVVLLTSSWFVARAVQATRTGHHALAIRLIYGGGLCGLAFIGIKAYEWADAITHGHTVSNQFFMFYFVLTGVHLFHVGLGLLIMGIVVRELRNPRRRRLSMVEAGGIYWHMVDLLWVVIFGLLYLMR